MGIKGRMRLVADALYTFHQGCRSYIYPLVKVIYSVIIGTFLFYRDDILPFVYHTGAHPGLKIVLNVITVIVVLFIMPPFYLSFVEAVEVVCNRRDDKVVKKVASGDPKIKTKDFTVDEIVNLIKESDIVEIKIAKNKKVIDIGSSSDCRREGFIFFDKRYYISSEEFEDIDAFTDNLASYLTNGKVKVLSIDGDNVD